MTQQLPDISRTSIKFNEFARILAALVPDFLGGAIYDLSSNNLWMSANFSKSTKNEIELFLDEQKGSSTSGTVREMQSKRFSDSFLLFAHTLYNHTQEPIGTLILVVQPQNEVEVSALEKKMAIAIKAIAAIISDMYQLDDELNAMSNELTERYEELNLVYDNTTDQVSSFSSVKRALQQLVKNCCIFMNIPFAAILLLDKRINIQHFTKSQGIDNTGHFDTELNKLYLWTLKKNLSLVLNDEKDPAWHELKTKLPYKLLSCPVTDKAGNTLGVIVSLKEKNDVDFVNSDRSLLMVMANKASKIIQTNYDSLTGLLNLSAFKYFLGQINFSSSQFTQENHTVLYIDLDHIQMINENMSHQAGDEVLRATAKLIKRLIRDKDIGVRIGGDKFGVLLYNCPPDRGLTISKRINSEIKKQELMWNEKTIQITACIGLASINVNSQNALGALDDAEIACNAAKEEGKNKISFFKFGDVDHTAMREEMRWAQIVQDSIKKNDLRLYCQKIHALNTENGPLHYEILLRAVDDTGAILEPKKLIPAAERYKLMPGVDRWVISNALSILERFWEKLQHKKPILAINISGQSFRDEAFLDFILSSLQNSTIPSTAICFEITETAAIGNLLAAQNLIKSLRDIGCTIALDDFGSGLSSFTYLKNLNIDYLKIDGSIIRDVVDSNIAETMVKAIKDVAEVLQLKTIGEYVENEAIAEHLSRMKIDYAQGYFIGRPVPLENELAGILSGKNTGKGREG